MPALNTRRHAPPQTPYLGPAAQPNCSSTLHPVAVATHQQRRTPVVPWPVVRGWGAEPGARPTSIYTQTGSARSEAGGGRRQPVARSATRTSKQGGGTSLPRAPPPVESRIGGSRVEGGLGPRRRRPPGTRPLRLLHLPVTWTAAVAAGHFTFPPRCAPPTQQRGAHCRRLSAHPVPARRSPRERASLRVAQRRNAACRSQRPSHTHCEGLLGNVHLTPLLPDPAPPIPQSFVFGGEESHL